MKLEYDKQNDMAYLSLKDVKRGESAYQTHGNGALPPPWQDRDDAIVFVYDWDADGKLLGIEFGPASKVIPADVLSRK